MTAPWPFGSLQRFGYDFIMADPAWPTQRRSPKGDGKSFNRHYGAMTWQAIYELPVGQLAAKHCVVMLWCPWGLLLHGGDPLRHFAGADAGISYVGQAIKRWGFRYVTGGVWHKRTAHGKTAFGTGYRLRDACEPFLIGITGAPKSSRAVRNILEGLRREHSRKPEEAFAWAEQLMPNARRVELFSRASRPGWDTWGYEAGKFDPVVHQDPAPASRRRAVAS